MTKLSVVSVFLLGASALTLSGCGLASLPGGYTPIEQQTVNELDGARYVPRAAEEREAILTQDLFAQATFWSREYDLNPADLEAAVNLSSTLRRLGNPAQSIEIAKHTRALYPRDVDLMTELGASYVATSQSRDALKIIDGALRQQPQNARLWSLKGAALDQLEMFGQARQNYTKALGLAPNDPSVLANVGLSFALEGDPKTAEIWLRRAANMPGASESVRQNLALVLGLQGKQKEADKWTKQDAVQSMPPANYPGRPLRGTAPIAAKTSQLNQAAPAPVRPYGQSRPANSLAQYESGPRPALGARLTVDGESTKGIRSASDAARAAARQQVKPLGQAASMPKPQANLQTNNPQAVLGQIAQGNQSKRSLAQQQRAQLINRAQTGQPQMQQGGYYPPQPIPYGQVPSQAQTPYGQVYAQPYPPQQQQAYSVSRPPARSRRR